MDEQMDEQKAEIMMMNCGRPEFDCWLSSLSRSVFQPINQSTNQPINQLTNWPINQLTN
jgi:hypothetical protein